MKRLLLFFGLTFFTHINANDDIDVLRQLFLLSNKNLEYAKIFNLNIEKNSSNNPTVIGYKAMSYFMLSKHLLNPYNKLANFKKGKLLIDKAIKLDSNNIELIFLRYCVQKNVPRILHYSENMFTDKRKILAYMSENKNTQNLRPELLAKIKQTIN